MLLLRGILCLTYIVKLDYCWGIDVKFSRIILDSLIQSVVDTVDNLMYTST